MKDLKYPIVFIGIISIFTADCSNVIENEEQNIEVQKRIGDENTFEAPRDTTNILEVQKMNKILDTIDWENAIVCMVRPPNLRFSLQNKNPQAEAKDVFCALWISPNKDKVELVIDAESKYAQLDATKSAQLFEVLTGEKLSGIK